MTITAEVKGRSADHFRTYVKETLTRRPNLEDHKKRLAAGKEPYPSNARIRHVVEQPAIEGPVVLDTQNLPAVEGEPTKTRVSFSMDAGETTVTRIVFFKGEGDEAQVVGAADVGAAGLIEVEFVEPVDPNTPEVFDEEA